VTECLCERCRPHDPAPTYTRAFLIECLAREIAALPTISERRARIESWEKRHGQASGERLKAAVRAVFGAER
jgi:hypothetical protein